ELLSLCLLLVAVATAKADQNADARATIDKAMKAMGGEEKLVANKAMTWKEKGTYYGMGAGLPYTGEFSVQWPDRYRMTIQGVFTIVLNGDKGWSEMGGTSQPIEGEQLKTQLEDRYAS